ncbi:MAG TPA: 2-hydroxychromene-2-carboxylate isomerase [Candidatus Omnitrophota bacterium]|nr:2-hydroxychromene-2-carboxylate isomerase [Candidatus Omnitrophota bacterium]
MTSVDFYFDFSSPYAYFASGEIDALAAEFGRSVAWRPILLGPAFKASGNERLIDQPLKGAYVRHDWERVARLTGMAYRFPKPFPVPTLAAGRAFWWLDERDPALAKRFAQAVFAAYFAEGRDITPRETVAEIGAQVGVPAAGLLAAVEDPRWKQKLKDETEAAIARGVFGAPFVFIGDEGFWGWDRLPMVRRWLKTGGWQGKE